MFRNLITVAILVTSCGICSAQYPFYRSRTTASGTTYYSNTGRIVGRSFNTGTRTYFSNSRGRNIGSSFTTRSGNTYFNRGSSFSSGGRSLFSSRNK